MPVRGQILKSMILLVWSVALTMLTLLLGAVPLLGLRRSIGRGPFWMLGAGLALGSLGFGYNVLALAFLVLTILVGVFCELDEAGWSLIASTGAAVFAGWSGWAIAMGYWAARQGADWFQLLVTEAQKVMDRVFVLSGSKGYGIEAELAIKAEDLVIQSPSAVAILLMLGLFFALILDKRIGAWMGERSVRRNALSDFRAPELTVWFLIASLLGAFIKADLGVGQNVAINVLNVCVLIYFFQGLAVIVKFFEVSKVGFFWRVLWLTLLVVQLFLVVSLVGLIDYWVDFRNRFIKRAPQMKKSL